MKTREWLNKNKIFFETITAILLSLMAIFVSIAQLGVAKNQLILSADPVVLVEPSSIVRNSSGQFRLFINNKGLAELYNIRLYYDYFVTMKQDDSLISLGSIGPFITEPNSTIYLLKPNQKKDFIIDIKDINEKMNEFYMGREGLQMRILRIKIKYCRKPDGKEYTQPKVYIIGGGGVALFDYDERGVVSPIAPSFEQIKKVLS